MRVISGIARGRHLFSLDGLHTRPTTDRVKESLFNIVAPYISGTALDLFAGSGALGIEALSRGAERCIFVENDFSAMQIVKKNLTLTGFSEKATLFYGTAERFLRETAESFNLIFIDPPYMAGLYEPILSMIASRGVCANHGVIAVERSAGMALPMVKGLTVQSDRKYGKTAITILHTDE